MSFELVFESGSLKGRRWLVPEGGEIMVGRSHTCGIRPNEPDVSGRHAVIRVNGGKIEIEALSAHKTAVDGVRLAAGERRGLGGKSRVRLGGSLAFSIRESDASGEPAEISPGETAMIGAGTRTYAGETGTFATAATRAAAGGETDFFGTEARTGVGETVATSATRAAETGTIATAATRAMAMETGTVATVATMAAPTGTQVFRSGNAKVGGRRMADVTTTVVAGDGETQMVTDTGITPPVEDDTSDSGGGGETQMLATQAVTPAEIERLRSDHVRRQRRRIGLKSVLFTIALGLVIGIYAWLSHPSVNPYLVAPSKISFNGVIRTSDGAIGIIVPNIRGGAPTVADDHQIRYETRLGDNWEVPFTIVLTNYIDRQSLYESAEASFERWRKANMKGLWVDRGESDRRHIFLGGGNGAYPGIPCLQHLYSNVGEDRENISGTATFFRIGPRCYVLLRELPASEDGRGAAWLTEVWATLFVQDKLAGNVDNMIVARHWEGTEEADEGKTAAEIVKDCRDALKSGAQNKWERVRKRLYVAMRMLYGAEGADADAVRSQVLDALQLLRQEQGNFWNEGALKASQYSNSTRDDAQKRMAEIKQSLKTYFKVPDDERTWILETEYWWLYRGPGE